MTSLADLEARVAALEADRADYRAVLVSAGALGQRVDGLNQSLGDLTIATNANREVINAVGEELAAHQVETRAGVSAVRTEVAELRNETRGNFRALDEQLAEIKDLIVDGFGGQRR